MNIFMSAFFVWKAICVQHSRSSKLNDCITPSHLFMFAFNSKLDLEICGLTFLAYYEMEINKLTSCLATVEL